MYSGNCVLEHISWSQNKVSLKTCCNFLTVYGSNQNGTILKLMYKWGCELFS